MSPNEPSRRTVHEAAVYRKVTWRLLPFLMLCYVAAYLDRVNIGFARLQMLDDLRFSETVYGLGAGIFFVGYFIFEVPSNLILHRVGARIWIGRTFWMPTLIQSAGVRGALQIGLLTAVPYTGAVGAMILFGRSADRRRERRWHTAIPMLIGAVGLTSSALAGTHTALAIVCLTVAAAGVMTCAPLFWSLPTALLGGTAAAAGIAAINSIGNLAGFVSPYVVGWLKDATESTAAGMYAVSAALVAGALVVLTIPAKLVNR